MNYCLLALVPISNLASLSWSLLAISHLICFCNFQALISISSLAIISILLYSFPSEVDLTELSFPSRPIPVLIMKVFTTSNSEKTGLLMVLFNPSIIQTMVMSQQVLKNNKIISNLLLELSSSYNRQKKQINWKLGKMGQRIHKYSMHHFTWLPLYLWWFQYHFKVWIGMKTLFGQIAVI